MPEQPSPGNEAPDEVRVDLEPAVHDETTFRIGNYNIQWFGDMGAGPSDEALQLERAAAVLQSADVDLWVLSEIVDENHFDELVARLPGFAGILANDPAVAEGSSYYRADEQKLAIVYREAVVQVASPRVVLASHSYEFASRPPIALDVTVRDRGATVAFTLIGVHMKAMSDSQSYQRRKQGSLALHGLLESDLAGRSVLVIGDWNDDVDSSIVTGKPTPFSNFASDADYRFLTLELSQANVGSRVTGHSFIDHQLAGGPIVDHYVEGSAERIEADDLFPDYGSTTSDHFPIVSTFTMAESSALIVNEVLANEPGSDTGHEFVEVVASGCDPVDLSRYSLRFDGAEVFRFPAGAVLAPGEAALVFSQASAVPASLPRAFSASGLGLLNRGGEIALVDETGSRRSGASWSLSTDGVSITRAVDGDAASGFVDHPLRHGRTSSPGTTVDGASKFAPCSRISD